MTEHARIDAIYVTHAAGDPMVCVDSVKAVAESGLDGDRYASGKGFYSNKEGWGANVTLIQAEAIAAVNKGHSTDFTGAMLRRNIVTANIKLDTLIGRSFRCGTAVFHGTKPFPPCAHLAYVLGRHEVLKYFAYCGGIGATVVTGGQIRVGDRIELIEI
jgi:MOSC domain-containing protein YiiM